LILFLKSVKQYNAKLFVTVPLSEYDGGKYICDNTNDIGHIIRRTAIWWTNIFEKYLEKKVCRIHLHNFHLKKSNKDKGMGYFLC